MKVLIELDMLDVLRFVSKEYKLRRGALIENRGDKLIITGYDENHIFKQEKIGYKITEVDSNIKNQTK